MKGQLKVVFVVIFLTLLAAAAAFMQTIDFTPGNDISATGNTAGNLYNGGYFCDYEGDVYFSWPADDYNVFRMSPDGSFKKLGISDAFSINICNNYLYYGRNGTKGNVRSFLDRRPYGIFRVSLTNGRSKVLCSSLSEYVCLSGSNLFFQEYTDTSLYFSRVSIKNSRDFERISSTGYPISCADDGYLYYAEMNENHNICRYDTRTGSASVFYEGNCYQPIYDDGFLYFIDLEDNYALKRYHVPSGELTVIDSDRCINYNVSGSVVFYQIENPDTGVYAMYRNNTAGTEKELVADRSCCHINIAGGYAYFQYPQDSYSFYRVGLTGPAQPEEFIPDLLNAQ